RLPRGPGSHDRVVPGQRLVVAPAEGGHRGAVRAAGPLGAEGGRSPRAALLHERERRRLAGLALADLGGGGLAVDLDAPALQVVVAGVLERAVHLGLAVAAGALELGDELLGQDVGADALRVPAAAGLRERVDDLHDVRLRALELAVLGGGRGAAGGER